MNRDEVIERIVGQYRKTLEEQEDEELLGDRLDEMREEVIDQLVDEYQEELEAESDEELVQTALKRGVEAAEESQSQGDGQ